MRWDAGITARMRLAYAVELIVAQRKLEVFKAEADFASDSTWRSCGVPDADFAEEYTEVWPEIWRGSQKHSRQPE